jgi:hypothetical protein
MRRRGFESHPVLFFDNSASVLRAHDVAAAYRSATAEVRVRLPLGTWFVRGVGKPGNPPGSGPGERRFESGRPDSFTPDRGSMSWFMCLPVKEEPAGSIPAPGAAHCGRASQLAMAAVSNTAER